MTSSGDKSYYQYFQCCLLISSRSNENFTDSVLLVGVVTDLVFTASLRNNGPDPAYSSSIVFTHPPSLTFSRVESGSQLTCLTDGIETTCTISGVRGQNSTVCLTCTPLQQHDDYICISVSCFQLAMSVRFVVLSGTVSGNEGTLSVTIASHMWVTLQLRTYVGSLYTITLCTYVLIRV